MLLKKNSSRKTYLLRCWQKRPATAMEPAVWHFVIEEILSHQPLQGFASLEALLAFLQAEFETEPASLRSHAGETMAE